MTRPANTRQATAKASAPAAKPPGSAPTARSPSRQAASSGPSNPATTLASSSPAAPLTAAATGTGATASAAPTSSAARTPAPKAGGNSPQAGRDGTDASLPAGAGAVASKLGQDVGATAAQAPTASRPGAHLFVGKLQPHTHDEIGLGSIVLAHEGPEDGWWEAEVIGANGCTFSLRWRDYPTQPTILRKATELALLPPGEA